MYQCEKMRFLLSSLLLASLCALSSWSVSSSLVVTQSPDVSVMEGETVKISCCWTGELRGKQIRVTWRKNQTDFKKEIFYSEKDPEGSLLKKTSDCRGLTFTNIKRENSGRYTCKITTEIPKLSEFEGNGTSITVTARDNGKTEKKIDPPVTGVSDSQWEMLIFILRCLPILALVMGFFCLYKSESRAQQRTAAASGNKITSAPGLEEKQEEEEEDERGEAE